jgi:gamma-glutamyl-gamma-aminobutyrate hydrolase PuuD
MVIALTQRILEHKNREYDCLERSWYTVLKDHTLIFVPNFIDIDIDADLLIITGGDNHPVRDSVEKKLIQKFINQNKPILGICHGAFELTKLLDGKVSNISNHMDTEHLVSYNNSWHNVNSFHSKAITTPPPESKILAIDKDNYCESWIKGNIGAIVWHPERMPIPFIPEEIKRIINYDVPSQR